MFNPIHQINITGTGVSSGSMVEYPLVYLRVGPGGCGHSRFIHDLSCESNQELHMRHNVTPKKFFGGAANQFRSMVRRCREQNMVAFDDIRKKDMCKASSIVYMLHPGFGTPCKNVDTVVLDFLDTGMRSCGEVDADDVMRHVFPGGDFEAHSYMLYQNITEVHHMLADGTVRVLACDGKKLEDAIVLSYKECIERVVKIHNSNSECAV